MRLPHRFWDVAAPVYDLATVRDRAGADQAAAYIAERLSPADLLLDAACGTGLFACALAPQVWRVLACDASPAMVARTRAKARRKRLRNLAARTGDVSALPLADDAVDAAVAGNVLHLLEQPEQAVAELKRVVRPGGYIAVPCYVLVEGTQSPGGTRLWHRAGFSPGQQWQAEDLLEHLARWGLQVEDHQVFAAFKPLCVARCRND